MPTPSTTGNVKGLPDVSCMTRPRQPRRRHPRGRGVRSYAVGEAGVLRAALAHDLAEAGADAAKREGVIFVHRLGHYLQQLERDIQERDGLDAESVEASLARAARSRHHIPKAVSAVRRRPAGRAGRGTRREGDGGRLIARHRVDRNDTQPLLDGLDLVRDQAQVHVRSVARHTQTGGAAAHLATMAHAEPQAEGKADGQRAEHGAERDEEDRAGGLVARVVGPEQRAAVAGELV
mmetsp:Transcript_31079/g.92591  ORF Transcript_31079/g.92591 Transcript_31079/m.92591 type:complete len:235 (-) Transcript_31079:176-880(-)